MKRTLTMIAGALALAGCTTTAKPKPEEIVRIVVEKIPVAVSCVREDFPTKPTYPDTKEALRAAPGPEDRYQLIARGRELRDIRLAQLEPAVEACRD